MSLINGMVVDVGGRVCLKKQSLRNYSDKPVPEVEGNMILSVDEMAEDLEFTIGVLFISVL